MTKGMVKTANILLQCWSTVSLWNKVVQNIDCVLTPLNANTYALNLCLLFF